MFVNTLVVKISWTSIAFIKKEIISKLVVFFSSIIKFIITLLEFYVLTSIFVTLIISFVSKLIESFRVNSTFSQSFRSKTAITKKLNEFLELNIIDLF